MTNTNRPFGHISSARSHVSHTYSWPVKLPAEAALEATRFYRGVEVATATTPAPMTVWFSTRRNARDFCHLLHSLLSAKTGVAGDHFVIAP